MRTQNGEISYGAILGYWCERISHTFGSIVGHDSDLSGFDLAASFKDNETRMLTIDAFSKGGN
jgi:hypothetical protein